MKKLQKYTVPLTVLIAALAAVAFLVLYPRMKLVPDTPALTAYGLSDYEIKPSAPSARPHG